MKKLQRKGKTGRSMHGPYLLAVWIDALVAAPKHASVHSTGKPDWDREVQEARYWPVAGQPTMQFSG